MRRNPAFSALAVVTLGLGIGTTTAISSVVHALLLRPLPFPESDRLVVLFATTPKRGLFQDTTSFLDFSEWRSQSRALAAAAAYRTDPFVLSGQGAAEPAKGLRASHELLEVLGVRPLLGRAFERREQQAGEAVALIGHALWSRRYGSDPNVVGEAIVVNDVRHRVLGVLPRGFQFPPFQDTDVLVPVPERPCRSCGYVRAVARLKAGVAVPAAQRELDGIAAALEKAFPESNAGRGVNVVPLHETAVGRVRRPLMVLLGAALFVLLIGCSNVGSLVLARGIASRRELAVRAALGAARGRLVRQALLEGVCLALVAATLGAVLAWLGSRLLVVALSQRIPLPAPAFEWPLLALAVGIALVSGVLTGVPTALMVLRSEAGQALKDGPADTGGLTQRRLSGLLVVSQTALTVMLLAAASLLLRSFLRMQQIDTGLDPRGALTANLMLPKRLVEAVRRELLVSQLLEAVGALPGVHAAAVHVDPPFQGGGRRETFNVLGHQDPGPGSGHPASFNIVSDGFFRAMGIRLLRGRSFDARDNGASEPVAMVNETMARRFWPQEGALGKRLRFHYDKDRRRWLSIVGVVRDVRYAGRLADPVPQVFVPSRQPFYKPQDPSLSLVVRTGIGFAGAPALRARIADVEKDMAILKLQTLERALSETAAEPRIYALLMGIFAAVALVIACAGICGVSAHAVASRTREIAVRSAVGATAGQIVRLMLDHGMRMALLGLAIGLAGSLALTKLLSSLLHGVAATDPLPIAAVVALFAAVASFAMWIPARRAARIDAMSVLRSN